MEQERKPLFLEEEQVEIHFEKPGGSLTFKRSIMALTASSAVKALAALVSHLAELCHVHPGDVLSQVAVVLFGAVNFAEDFFQHSTAMGPFERVE